MKAAVCKFCGCQIPLNDKGVFVKHNALWPEGLSECQGSLRRVEKDTDPRVAG